MSGKSAFQKRRRSVAQRRVSGIQSQKASSVATLRENNYHLAKRLEETELSLERHIARNVSLQGQNAELTEELILLKAHMEEIAGKRAEELARDMVKYRVSRYAAVCCEVSSLLSRATNELKMFEETTPLVSPQLFRPTLETSRCQEAFSCRRESTNGKENIRPGGTSRGGKSTARKRRRKQREVDPKINIMHEVREEGESAVKVCGTPSSIPTVGSQWLIQDRGSPFLGQPIPPPPVSSPNVDDRTLQSVDFNEQLLMSQNRPRREACSVLSYAEPSLKDKLRRGDPFTESHPEYEDLRCFNPSRQGSKSCSVVRIAKRRRSTNQYPLADLSAEY